MAHLESAFIKRSIFDNLRGERLQCGDLERNEMYVAMFSLVNNTEEREAAMLPVIVKDVVRIHQDAHLGVVALLNSELVPVFTRNGVFNDGYWTNVGTQVGVTESPPVHHFGTEECYFRVAEDGSETGNNELRRELLLTA